MSVLPRMPGPALVAAILVSVPAAAQDADGWRTIEIETTEVTAPDVAITPDGETLIFTLLGHLLVLPVEGGDAEQLTFGPYYDARPAVSPDGTQVAFQSDRDGSEGNRSMGFVSVIIVSALFALGLPVVVLEDLAVC